MQNKLEKTLEFIKIKKSVQNETPIVRYLCQQLINEISS